MEALNRVLSPQEERIEKGRGDQLTGREAADSRPRINRMLKDIRKKPPRIAIERARLMVESFKKTEGLPPVLRWAEAVANVLNKTDIQIGKDELIVGRCGPPGRYGILYPELRGAWLEKGLETLPTRQEGKFDFREEDARVIRDEILPYWKGRTVFEATYRLLPEETRNILYEKDDPYTPRYVVIDTTTDRTSLQWVPDYAKVLKLGFEGIRQEAEEKLAALDLNDPANNYGKRPFLLSVITVCNGMIQYGKRHAEHARKMAEEEGNEQRKAELLEIAAVCERVPGKPARNFREALQAQWFTQVGFRFEQFHGGTVSNGRIDQYLYPFYKGDKETGSITDDDALELLENLWINMAQNVTFRQSGTIQHWEGVPHFEHTNIGGQTREGRDATNELSYLILESKKEFPLDYPDLSARIHSRTPERFLYKICELIKEGTGFPKLLNDEIIIPRNLAKGASLEEARDYNGSGCSESRLPNRETYLTGNADISLGACVEMVLKNGVVKSRGEEPIGIQTGDPRRFETFQEFMQAFKDQLAHLIKQGFILNQTADTVRPLMLGAPLQSSLTDVCMENCKDVHQGRMDGAIITGHFMPLGFGTAVDSLAAVKKLVYDDKRISMDELMTALDANFEGNEMIRQLCLNAPKYGNNDLYADAIGREVEDFIKVFAHNYTNLHGGKLSVVYVPITKHVPFGRAVGALPNGRKAGEALSDGISPSQGADTEGPTATLLSLANTTESKYEEVESRLFNVKLSPQSVAGDLGTRKLASLIRTWCDLKLWHMQFNIVNSQTLIDAQKHPEKYRNLLVRVAGYSAYFVDLSKDLQNEIIARAEKTF